MRVETSTGLHEGPFARVELRQDDALVVEAQEKPTAVWVPANARVVITTQIASIVLDVAEVVEHHDVVTMEKRIKHWREYAKKAIKGEKQARRRLRRIERTGSV